MEIENTQLLSGNFSFILKVKNSNSVRVSISKPVFKSTFQTLYHK